MTKGMDCANPLTADKARALADAGMMFAARYLVPDTMAWKRMTRAEAEGITAAGMRIVSVYEKNAGRAAGGAAVGKIDGAEACKEAQLIGQPVGSAIYFAVDYDAEPKDYDAIENYLIAALNEIPGYKLGVYGSYNVIEEMARRKVAGAYWQTYAWSQGRKSDHANIYQYQNGCSLAGVSLDLDESYGNEGWWNTKPAAADPQPTTADNIKVVLNDKLAAYGRIIDGHVYLPLRQLGEALDKAVNWDNNDKLPYVDGRAVETFRLIDGQTYVDVRAAAELLGGTVSWNGQTKKVYIYQ